MVENEQIIDEEIDRLVVDKNSRWRVDIPDLAELMESIKQHGVLQPITARQEDRVIICGNRRFMACKKLGLKTIPVRYLSHIDDKQLLVLNLTENIQRKDISSIEIGREVYVMLHNKDWSISIGEIAVKLGCSQNRIKSCLAAYTSLPEEFRKNVVHQSNDSSRKIGTLPENVVQSILNLNRSLSRQNRSIPKLTSTELNWLFVKARDDCLTIGQINLLMYMLLMNIPLRKAYKNLDNYSILRVNFITLKTELDRVMSIEGIRIRSGLMNKIIKDKYPNLIY